MSFRVSSDASSVCSRGRKLCSVIERRKKRLSLQWMTMMFMITSIIEREDKHNRKVQADHAEINELFNQIFHDTSFQI